MCNNVKTTCLGSQEVLLSRSQSCNRVMSCTMSWQRARTFWMKWLENQWALSCFSDREREANFCLTSLEQIWLLDCLCRPCWYAPKGQCTDCTDISRKSASDGSSARVYGGVCLCMFVWWLSSSWTQNYERNSSSLFSALSFPSHVFASISRSPRANPQQVLPLTLRALSLPLKFALHRVTVRGAGGKILYGARHAASPSFA